MSAIDQLFREYRSAGRKALIPFLTAGDPDLEFTGLLVRELDRRGCALCELGVPYSDPIADGPVIQASYTRALAGGVKTRAILELAGQLRRPAGSEAAAVRMPLVTMISYAIVYRLGLQQFVRDAVASGVSGAIVPDLLVEEAGPLAEVCREHDFSLIQLVTPTTPRERARRIAATSTGFLYYVSVTGITGERRELPPELVDNVAWLRHETDLPICIGFGISGPEQVRQLAPVADGLIVGSAFVRRIADVGQSDRAAALRDVGQFASQLLEALNERG
ncbi:MAG: tryptophan synthase subunit alpha [Pirellulaceae bacterium]|nr:tryptophan synthase subunit alpha [Pirellulaceae bacterium]